MLTPEATGPTCVVRRTLPAPRALVYRAWTDPVLVARWSWGRKYETVSLELDCRVGGRFRQQIRDKESGETWFFEGVYREVVPGKKLVHTFHFHSDRGKDDGESLVSIELEERGKSTEVIITHTQLADDERRKGTEAGWEDVLECIERVLATESAAAH